MKQWGSWGAAIAVASLAACGDGLGPDDAFHPG